VNLRSPIELRPIHATWRPGNRANWDEQRARHGQIAKITRCDACECRLPGWPISSRRIYSTSRALTSVSRSAPSEAKCRDDQSRCSPPLVVYFVHRAAARFRISRRHLPLLHAVETTIPIVTSLRRCNVRDRPRMSTLS